MVLRKNRMALAGLSALIAAGAAMETVMPSRNRNKPLSVAGPSLERQKEKIVAAQRKRQMRADKMKKLQEPTLKEPVDFS